MEIVYENDWMEIVKKGDQYIIRYNSGDLTNSISEAVVSKADAEKAQESDESAYEIILKYQNHIRSNGDFHEKG